MDVRFATKAVGAGFDQLLVLNEEWTHIILTVELSPESQIVYEASSVFILSPQAEEIADLGFECLNAPRIRLALLAPRRAMYCGQDADIDKYHWEDYLLRLQNCMRAPEPC